MNVDYYSVNKILYLTISRFTSLELSNDFNDNNFEAIYLHEGTTTPLEWNFWTLVLIFSSKISLKNVNKFLNEAF